MNNSTSENTVNPPPTPPILPWALFYAARGFQVFPTYGITATGACACGDAACADAGKHPIGGVSWKQIASSDPERVRAVFLASARHVSALNYAIAVPDGVFVADFDPRNGSDASAQELAAAGFAFADSLCTVSGSGGKHLFYRVPPGKRLPGKLAKGIDVRQSGNYVIGPGSMHASGGVYTTPNPHAELEAAPDWIAGRMFDAGTQPKRERDPSRVTAPSVLSDDVVARIGDLLVEHVPGDGKHATMVRLGCWFYDRGLPLADAEAVADHFLSNRADVRSIEAGLDAVGWAYGPEAQDPKGYLELIGLVGDVVKQVEDLLPPSEFDRNRAELDAMLKALFPAPALEVAPPTANDTTTSLAERLRARKYHAEPALPTGIDTFDAMMTFGGIPLDYRVIVGGAPDAGKTAWVLQAAENMSARGAAVAWNAVDEDVDGIDTRRLQALGVPRARAMRGMGPDGLTSDDVATAERELGDRVFEMFDGRCYVEDILKLMAERYPNTPRVFVGDSLQKIRSRRSATKSNPFERMQVLIDDIIRAQEQWPCMIVLTSELSRDAYKNKRTAEDINPMAAVKGAGEIEYFAKTMVNLRSGKDGAVSCEIAKNKAGRKGTFELALDRDTLQFSASAADADEDAAKQTKNEKDTTALTLLRDYVREHMAVGAELSLKLARQVARCGHNDPENRARARWAIKQLVEDDVLAPILGSKTSWTKRHAAPESNSAPAYVNVPWAGAPPQAAPPPIPKTVAAPQVVPPTPGASSFAAPGQPGTPGLAKPPSPPVSQVRG